MYGTCGRIDNKADFDFDFYCFYKDFIVSLHVCQSRQSQLQFLIWRIDVSMGHIGYSDTVYLDATRFAFISFTAQMCITEWIKAARLSI